LSQWWKGCHVFGIFMCWTHILYLPAWPK
jgi:hypothetical protein